MSSISSIPDRDHYGLAYLGNRLLRLESYRQQLEYALRTLPQKALLVGKGDGILQELLQRAGCDVTTLDIKPELGPDIVASVESIPLPENSVDVSLCCQVLEHLPFAKFGQSLRSLAGVTRDRLVLSLPDIRRCFSIRIGIHRWHIEKQFSLPYLRRRPFPESQLSELGHHWEIGYDGTPMPRVCGEIENAGWKILEIHRVSDMPWHTFIYCGR